MRFCWRLTHQNPCLVHKSTKLTPKTREEIYRAWCKNRPSFRSLAEYHHVDKNIIQKIILRGRLGDFTVHDSANRRFRSIEYGLKRLSKTEATIAKRLAKKKGIWVDKTDPGLLIHADTKRLPRIVGTRVDPTHPKTRSTLFVAIDDATRILFADILPDGSSESAAIFLETCLYRMPFLVHTLFSDNGGEWKGNVTHPVSVLTTSLGIQQRFTKPYHPWTNGKAERVIRTIMDEWFTMDFSTEQARRNSLYAFVDNYNHHRPHRSLNGSTPMQKLAFLNESGDNP